MLLAAAAVPLWILAPNKPLIVLGAFVMQFMVQGAWGVIPAHINELSPPQLRGFFPGLAYQFGVLVASSIGYLEAVLGEHFSYAISMGSLALLVLCSGQSLSRPVRRPRASRLSVSRNGGHFVAAPST